MDALSLQRESLILEHPQMVMLFVSSCETLLQKLWLQVRQLVISLSLQLFVLTCR